MKRSQLLLAMRRDLWRSGISKRYIKQLGVKVLTPVETEQFMTKGRGDLFGVPSYEIPYFDTHGRKTGYSRLKNLKQNIPISFGRQSGKKKKIIKYMQRANTPPHLYTPPVIKWPRNAEGMIAVPRLVVTEGEKKAICACLRGIYCVALGGVDSFKSTKRSVSMLAEFDQFDLSETIVEICYDSDFNTNPDVQRAAGKLSAELLALNPKGLNIVYIDGETTDDGKMGLDDFLVQYEDDGASVAFDRLPRKEDDRFSRMNILSADLCYLTRVGKLYNIPDDRYYDSPSQLIVDYGPKLRVTDPDNPHKQIPAVKLWLETRSTENTNCDRTIYEPGKPQRYRVGKDKRDSINVWRASPIKPIEGDCSLWLELVRFIMGTEAKFNWFMQWLSFPLQHPGTKLLQAVFVYSHSQGIGKNFVMEPLIRDIYGDNYQVITSADLDSPHNAWAAQKQLIFGEEIYMSDKRDRETTMGKLKSLISNEFVSVNEKYRPLEKFKNYGQYYITANQSNALALDSADRRFFVVHAPEEPKPVEFYEKLNLWARKPTSAGKVLSHLLYKVDCSQFNPNAHAMKTTEKFETIEHGQDLVQTWVNELAADPEKFYTMNHTITSQQLFGAIEIHLVINTYLKDKGYTELKISPMSIGKYLSASNKFPYRRVKLPNGSKKGLYAVFNRDYWKSVIKKEKPWLDHYKTHEPGLKRAEKSKLAGNAKTDDNVLPFSPKTKPRATL